MADAHKYRFMKLGEKLILAGVVFSWSLCSQTLWPFFGIATMQCL
jgi:hypothetical protein